MRKTTLKTTPNDHAADAVADAQVHADEIARDEAATKAEDAAFEARGKAVDAAASDKRAKADAARRRAFSQFAAVCECIRVRTEIVRKIKAFIKGPNFGIGAFASQVADHLVADGCDPEFVRIVLATADEFIVKNGYVNERR